MVHLENSVLRPGDEAAIDVILRVGDALGEIVHEAIVVTEPPSSQELVLRTTARAYPSIRVEEVEPANGMILLSTDEPRQVECRVLALGTATAAPVDLDQLELHPSTMARWLGPKKSRPDDEHGLKVESRRFAACLDTAGSPGARTAGIRLHAGERLLHEHLVHWEVVSPITATPRMAALMEERTTCRILIRSHDQKPFQIMRFESTSPGIRVETVHESAARTHTIIVNLVDFSQASNPQDSVTLFTDHPAQQQVSIPILVLR